MTVGQRIIKLRKIKKISQKELSILLNCSQPNISDYENDKISPSFTTLEIIRKSYNVNLDWLITGEGNMFLTDQNTQETNNKGSSNQNEIDYYIKRVKELETQTNELKKNIQSIEDSYNQATDNFSQERLKNSELFSKNQMLNDELTSRLRELVECKDLVIKLSLK